MGWRSQVYGGSTDNVYIIGARYFPRIVCHRYPGRTVVRFPIARIGPIPGPHGSEIPGLLGVRYTQKAEKDQQEQALGM